jgi:hypothetical protein
VLYHSDPTFGQVLYYCLDAFVVDVSDYSGHLIRHLLNASEAFPTEWFLQFWKQVTKSGGLSPPDFLTSAAVTFFFFGGVGWGGILPFFRHKILQMYEVLDFAHRQL